MTCFFFVYSVEKKKNCKYINGFLCISWLLRWKLSSDYDRRECGQSDSFTEESLQESRNRGAGVEAAGGGDPYTCASLTLDKIFQPTSFYRVTVTKAQVCDSMADGTGGGGGMNRRKEWGSTQAGFVCQSGFLLSTMDWQQRTCPAFPPLSVLNVSVGAGFFETPPNWSTLSHGSIPLGGFSCHRELGRGNE